MEGLVRFLDEALAVGPPVALSDDANRGWEEEEEVGCAEPPLLWMSPPPKGVDPFLLRPLLAKVMAT